MIGGEIVENGKGERERKVNGESKIQDIGRMGSKVSGLRGSNDIC